jgi:hypothetical protein
MVENKSYVVMVDSIISHISTKDFSEKYELIHYSMLYDIS